MNKAFVREPDGAAEYCPRCGSKGEPVGPETLRAYLTDEQRGQIASSANFCPSPNCKVAYFDSFKRVVLAADLPRPVFPKDSRAPVCACFGLTLDQIEHDAAEGNVTRVREIIEKARSPAARCTELAANGRPCTAYVQKCYLQSRGRGE
jgi:transposase